MAHPIQPRSMDGYILAGGREVARGLADHLRLSAQVCPPCAPVVHCAPQPPQVAGSIFPPLVVTVLAFGFGLCVRDAVARSRSLRQQQSQTTLIEEAREQLALLRR